MHGCHARRIAHADTGGRADAMTSHRIFTADKLREECGVVSVGNTWGGLPVMAFERR